MNGYTENQVNNATGNAEKDRPTNTLSDALIIQQLQQLFDEQRIRTNQKPAETESASLVLENPGDYGSFELSMDNQFSTFNTFNPQEYRYQPGVTAWTPDSSHYSLTPTDGSCNSQNDILSWVPSGETMVPNLSAGNSFYSHDELITGSTSYATLPTDSMNDLNSFHQQPLVNYSSYSLASTANPYAYVGTNVCNYQHGSFSNATALSNQFYDPSCLVDNVQPVTIMPSMSSFIKPAQSQMQFESTVSPQKSVSTGCTRRQRQKKEVLARRKMSVMDLTTYEREMGGFDHDDDVMRQHSTKAATSRATGKTSYKKGRNVEKACNHCKRSHLRCDNVRPCGRCVSTGKHDCHDVEHKPRGRPRTNPKK